MACERPRDHNELLLSLKRTLTTEDLEDIKLVVRARENGGFQDAELEKIQNVRDMLLELEVKGVIKVGHYRKLKGIMKSIGHRAAIDDIERKEKFLRDKGYGIESSSSNSETTSKRFSQPHRPLDNSSGYGSASAASDTEMTSKRVSHPHQPALDNSSGFNIDSTSSNTETTSKRVSRPHKRRDNSSEICVKFESLRITDTTVQDGSSARLLKSASPDNAESLRETAALFVTGGPLQAAGKVEKILRRRYENTGSYVQIIPWVSGEMKLIRDIYTKLKLQYTKYPGKQLKSYEDMFLEKTKEGDSIQRIILEGRAGIGKSALIDKMAYDWAIGEKLKEYKLVFILKMFALEESLEFIDAIWHQLINEDKAISKDDLMSYITTNPEKVLILFDGFDEFKTTDVSEASQSSGDVSQILNRKILSESCVVVTTRHSHFHKLVSKSVIEKPFVHVKVLGFTEKDIKQYIRRFFSTEHDKAEGLIQRIKSSDVRFDLATSPMLLLLMCILWREQSTIPDTMYRLYTKALEYIFKRKQLPPDEASQVFKTIGRNALDDLLSSQQFLSFKEGDFDNQALRSALKAGILTSQRVIKGLDTRHSVSFNHRTFQEYCAAIFFQSLLKTDKKQFNKNLDRVGKIMKDSPQRLEYLLRFCCGDSQSFTNKVLSLIQKCVRQGTMIEEELSVTCYFEGQFEDLPSVDLVTEKIITEGYSNDGVRALLYYQKHVKMTKKKAEKMPNSAK